MRDAVIVGAVRSAVGRKGGKGCVNPRIKRVRPALPARTFSTGGGTKK